MFCTTGSKPFSCGICGKAYLYKQNLTDHMVIHTGMKRYKCKTCGKSFTQKQSLAYHLTIHTGVKPYKCDTCGKSFRQKRNLTTLITPSFGNHLFANYHILNQPLTNLILSSFYIPKVLKSAAKSLEIGSQITI